MSIFQTVEAALIAAGQKIESVLEPKALALWNIGKSAFAQMEALGIPQLEAATAAGFAQIATDIASGESISASVADTDVLQLSGLLAGDVKESRNDSPTGDLPMAGRPNPASYFVRSGGIFAILFRCAMLRNCWRSAVSMSITQRSGTGCSITALNWSSDCDSISSRQTSLGESTKPTSV